MQETHHPSIEPEQWLDEYGDMLFRYARARVGSYSVAEDLVQETFLSALRSMDSFQNHSSLQTWLVGILRHKILDHYRRTYKEAGKEDCLPDHPAFHEDNYFDRWNHWNIPIQRWDRPDSAVAEEEFMELISGCIQGLPAEYSVVFQMRVLDDIPYDEIGKSLNLSTFNGGVVLHRARLFVQQCITSKWFS